MAQYFNLLLVLFLFGTQSSFGAPSAADITDIVALHNQLRSAKCVKDLQWDAGIASIAQSYSDGCKYAHSGIAGYGENIAYGSGGSATAKRLTQLWADEISDYTCGDTNGIFSAGHYTQMTWNTTTLIGCGFSACSFGNYLVCNYKAPGNYIGRIPYTCPDQCSASPSPTPTPATTGAPRPVTTAPRPATTAAPRPATTAAPRPATTAAPRPVTTAPRPATTGRTTAKITTGQVPATTGRTGNAASGSVSNGRVTTAREAVGSVTTGRLASNAVTTARQISAQIATASQIGVSSTSGRGSATPAITSPLTTESDFLINSNSGEEDNIEDIDGAGEHDDRLIGLSKPAAVGVIFVVILAIVALAAILVALFVMKRRRTSRQFENSLIITPPVEPLPTAQVAIQPPPVAPAPSSPLRPVVDVDITPPPPSPKLTNTSFHGSPCAPRYYAKSHGLNNPSHSPVTPRLTVGAICQAMWSGDSQFYRARIDDIQGHNYLVTYLDFGDQQEWVPKLCLRM